MKHIFKENSLVYLKIYRGTLVDMIVIDGDFRKLFLHQQGLVM